MKAEELPEQLQKMSADEREAYVKEMAAKRAAIQQQIGKLSVERDAYLASLQKPAGGVPGEATLGDAVVEAIGSQLSAAGFEQ